MEAGKVMLSIMGSLADKDLSCAALNGVDATIVDRANYLVEIDARGEDLVSACTKISKKEEDDLNSAVKTSDRMDIENKD